MNKLVSLIQVIFLLCISLVVVECVFPVIIDSPEVRFSPRLDCRTTVVYRNKMYVYGGRTVTKSPPTNQMYSYDFETDPDAARMSLVNQKNSGPICYCCGGIMIDDHRMMILTKEIVPLFTSPNLTDTTIVRPHIFDFETSTWEIDDRIPIYNESQKDIFQVRVQHTTVLGNDGLVYTIGGTDFFYANSTQESWYYNPVDNSYGVIANNGFPYYAIDHSSFVLSNTTIGSIYGRDFSAKNLTYYPTNEMRVLDTVSKSWIAPQIITLDGITYNGVTGAATTTFGNGKYVISLGGYVETEEGGEIMTDIRIINLATNQCSILTTLPMDYFVAPRVSGSAVIISEEYLVFGFGLGWIQGSTELPGIDVLRLPKISQDNNSLNEPSSLEGTWMTSFSTISPSPPKDSKKRMSTLIIFVIVFCILIAICLGLILLALISREELTGRRDPKTARFCAPIRILEPIWPRRIGETFSSQFYTFSARILLCILLIGFIAYFLYNIINSSISTTDSFEDKETMKVPDIRFCYSGWKYDNIFDSGEKFPELFCQNLKSANTSYGCGEIVHLNRNISTPSFPGQPGDTKCYMYKSTDSDSIVSKDSPELLFNHLASITSNDQMIYIQFYEPKKNPNRVVYLGEDVSGMNINYIDKWLESEGNSNSDYETVSRVLTVYPGTYCSIQFENVYTATIDPNNFWNYIGIFPKYIYNSELTITHSDIMKYDTVLSETLDAPKVILGEIKIAPASFTVKTTTEKRDDTFVSALGVFAGIVSILLAIQVFLFGATPANPWGMFQKASFRSYQKEKKKEELERYFGIPDVKSLPFVTPVHHRFTSIYSLNSQQLKKRQNPTGESLDPSLDEKIVPPRMENSSENEILEDSSLASVVDDLRNRLSQLEGRNQILELILKSYYIDDKIFREAYLSHGSELSAPNTKQIDQE